MNDESFDEKIIMGDLNEGVDCGEQSFGPRELFSGGGGGGAILRVQMAKTFSAT